jgi:protein-L-isoaspartate(D-aspartate) O-methyltransferase
VQRIGAVLAGSLVTLLMMDATTSSAESDSSERERRQRMVEQQLEGRGIADPRVLEAMRSVPRHLFVPEQLADRAYDDSPLPIGNRQTISQPYIVAIMSELLQTSADDTVLEIGTGSGYQAAVLSRLVRNVYSIEIVEELADRARKTLAQHDYDNVVVVTGDGYRGLPEYAPFDGIIVTAAPETIPQPLIDQLAVGARLVIPVGEGDQQLMVLERDANGIESRKVIPVRFVPMTGETRKPGGHAN